MADPVVPTPNPAPAPVAPTPPAADFARPPVGAPGGPPIPPTIPLTIEEYQRLRGLEKQLADYQTQQAQMAAEAEAQRLKILAEKEGAEKALAEQRAALETKIHEHGQKYTELERSWFEERKSAVLAEALAGRALAGPTPEVQAFNAQILRSHLQDKFETVKDASGSLVVREKVTGRLATEVLRELLDSPQYSTFFAPNNRGGAEHGGARPPATPQPPAPGSLAAIKQDWEARQAQYGGFGFKPVSK